MIINKKSSLILILKVLEEYTDEDHLLTQQQIIDKISQLYNIDLERKSVSNSISLLIELGYDIVSFPRKGYCLLSRLFDDSEITFLIDAIFSSKSISGKQAEQLANKCSSILSKYKRKNYSYLYKSEEINRTENKDVFLTIEIISEAIKNKKCISFQYLSYDENCKLNYRYNGYRYIVSPYYLINNFGRYYLICHRKKYNKIINFRVDYIKNVEIIDKEYIDIKTLEEYKNGFSISNYLNDHIYIFGGEIIKAKFLINNPASISYIVDWFKDNAKIYQEDNKIYAEIKCNENALYYWYMQYNEHFIIIEPISLIERVKKSAEDILNKM